MQKYLKTFKLISYWSFNKRPLDALENIIIILILDNKHFKYKITSQLLYTLIHDKLKT